MKIIFWIFFLTLSINHANASVVYMEQDSVLFQKYVNQFNGKSKLPLSQLIAETALYFRGSPYVASTLDKNDVEKLTVNLKEFDCTTFVETCIALSKMIKTGNYCFSNFCDQLLLIRYRGGDLDGYSSRLHYVTDWIYDNQKRNTLSDKTIELGGVRDGKKINFMSNHVNSYPQLQSNIKEQTRIKKNEYDINNRATYGFIKKENIEQVKSFISDGDIIAFATSIDGLDYTHIAIAYRVRGELTFLHASTKKMEVVIEPQSLSNYCIGSSKCTGISVFRLK